MNETIGGGSDRRVDNEVMWHEYKVLTDEEKFVVKEIKDKGLDFYRLCEVIGQSRELSLARTKIEEAVFWAVKHITKMVVLFMIFGLVACTSTIKRPDGTWDVPAQVERRSVFGSNQSGMLIDSCKKEVVRWYWENQYEECTEKVGYQFASSPGVGGPIVSGALMGLGLGVGLSQSGTRLNQHVDNGGVIYNKK